MADINLGIPAEQTERIIPVNRIQTNVFESEGQQAFISLPLLFGLKNNTSPHGLILKTLNDTPQTNVPVKTILLTPKIDNEIEIPQESIYRLPEVFTGIYSFFSGIYFTGGSQNLILILNPKQLTEIYHD